MGSASVSDPTKLMMMHYMPMVLMCQQVNEGKIPGIDKTGVRDMIIFDSVKFLIEL